MEYTLFRRSQADGVHSGIPYQQKTVLCLNALLSAKRLPGSLDCVRSRISETLSLRRLWGHYLISVRYSTAMLQCHRPFLHQRLQHAPRAIPILAGLQRVATLPCARTVSSNFNLCTVRSCTAAAGATGVNRGHRRPRRHPPPSAIQTRYSYSYS